MSKKRKNNAHRHTSPLSNTEAALTWTDGPSHETINVSPYGSYTLTTPYTVNGSGVVEYNTGYSIFYDYSLNHVNSLLAKLLRKVLNEELTVDEARKISEFLESKDGPTRKIGEEIIKA